MRPRLGDRSRSRAVQSFIGASLLLSALSAHGSAEPLTNAVGRQVSLGGFVSDSGVEWTSPGGSTLTAEREGPWVLALFYARCPRTCAPLVENLRRALDPLRTSVTAPTVVLVSIDPDESLERLREFRRRLVLPADWILLRAGSRSTLDFLLRTLAFVPVPLADGEIDHPNVVYVISAKNRVASVLPGLSPRTSELVAALESAQTGRSSGSGYLVVILLVLASALVTVVMTQAFQAYARWQAGRTSH